MARKVIQLDLTTGELAVTPLVVEASEVDTAPTAAGIPRADGLGQIDAGWIPDAVRTVNVEEPDGVPALTDIATLVFDAGTVANLGGGKARITGGGGDTINLQGRPIAANEPEVGQAIVWSGSQWAPGTISGGGSDWLTSVQLIGLVDGVNTTFDLPAPAIPSSLSVYLDVGGTLTTSPYTAPLYEDVVLGLTPTANGYNQGGYYGSSPVSCLVDGAITGTFWSSGYTQPVVFWELPTAKAVTRATVYANGNGGFGGMDSFEIAYSDDGATWTVAATAIPTNGVYGIPSQDVHAWWRITGLTKGYYEWSAIEMILEAPLATIQTIVLDEAPEMGTVPRASFRVAPTIETGGSSGGSSGADSGPGGALALFDRYW